MSAPAPASLHVSSAGREFIGLIREAGPAPESWSALEAKAPLDPEAVLARPLAPVPVAIGRPRHSATALLAWSRCPVKHYYKYVAGVREPRWTTHRGLRKAIASGQVVHDVLEHLREEAELDLLLEDAIGRWDEEAPPPEGREGADIAPRSATEIERGVIASRLPGA